MKVKMISAVATTCLVLSHGEVVNLEDEFAESLVKANLAVLVEEERKAPKKQKPMSEPKTPKRGRKKKVVE